MGTAGQAQAPGGVRARQVPEQEQHGQVLGQAMVRGQGPRQGLQAGGEARGWQRSWPSPGGPPSGAACERLELLRRPGRQCGAAWPT